MEKLSEIQKTIIKLSAKGYKNQAIATELAMSINTVKYHKKEIFQKLNVSFITEALYISHINELL